TLPSLRATIRLTSLVVALISKKSCGAPSFVSRAATASSISPTSGSAWFTATVVDGGTVVPEELPPSEQAVSIKMATAAHRRVAEATWSRLHDDGHDHRP